MKSTKRLKWNITVFPVLTHFIVAQNMRNEIKFLKTDGILSVGSTKRIVKNLIEKG